MPELIWLPNESWGLLKQLQSLLAMVIVALMLVFVALCLNTAAGSTRPRIRRQWLTFASAALLAGLISVAVVLMTPYFPSNALTLLYQLTGMAGALALGYGIRLALRGMNDIGTLKARLRETGTALEAYQAGLEQLVGNRTQALRHEIEERRKSQQQLGRANQQLQRDLTLAGEIQKAMLPAVESPDFAWVGLHFKPADAVSGDIYGLASDEDTLRIVVADAMGHGVSAALMTQAILAAAQRTPLRVPESEMFERVNSTLLMGSQMAYVTAACIRLNRSGALSYVSAGAPSLLIWRARKNTMEVVDGSAPPLGMFVKASDSFAHSSLRLSPGDRAFLYTDGLSESRDANGQLLGTEGVSRFLLSRAQTPLPELSAELEAFLLERNSKINDDVTLIGVEYDPDQD